MGRTPRIVIAEDEPLLCEGLPLLRAESIKVVATDGSGWQWPRAWVFVGGLSAKASAPPPGRPFTDAWSVSPRAGPSRPPAEVIPPHTVRRFLR